MTIEIKVPPLPESVNDATVAKWHKKVGEFISRDENLIDLETDKVMLEVPAPQSGIIEKLMVKEGDTVTSNQLLAVINTDEGKATEKPAEKTAKMESHAQSEKTSSASQEEELSPAVRRLVAEKGLNIAQITGTGKGGRVTKEDVEHFIQKAVPSGESSSAKSISQPSTQLNHGRSEKRVPMSRLRTRIAERLVKAQHEAAMLTTFNEVNMQPIMELRNQYKDQFEKRHGVRLGFMSFFTKASTEALKRFPVVNAFIDGQDVLYHNYYDIGIAIGSERGLVVPILRDVESMGLADIEKAIKNYAALAQTGKLTMEDLTGGTFTITNGGTYGSMLSTPIINPPQTAILGMHKIMERPVVEKGQIVVRPMMYLALSYDHRLIDGREAVQFLVAIKELLEDPARILLDV